jgi:preprotein translocase subunit Sec61beta
LRNVFKRINIYVATHMSSKKKNAPLPASSAGLLRFFEDETRGVKVRPEIVLGITGAFIGASIMIRILFPVG